MAFSPSGDRVAISPGGFDSILIGGIRDAGIAIERRILDDFEGCASPRWAAENLIVFAGRQVPGAQQIWVVDLDSGTTRQVTRPPIATRDFLTLSPDRTAVVFTATNETEPLEWRLWRVRLDGSELEQLTKGGDLSAHLSPVFVD